jgi:hypothetical protein
VLFKQLPPDTFLKSFSMLLSSIITLPEREREREREREFYINVEGTIN